MESPRERYSLSRRACISDRQSRPLKQTPEYVPLWACLNIDSYACPPAPFETANFPPPVVSITAFGAFMEVLPGKDGLIHVSELAEGRTEKVEDVVKKGEVISAKCLGVDERGRVKMSRRAWLRDQAAEKAEAEGATAE